MNFIVQVTGKKNKFNCCLNPPSEQYIQFDSSSFKFSGNAIPTCLCVKERECESERQRGRGRNRTRNDNIFYEEENKRQKDTYWDR